MDLGGRQEDESGSQPQTHPQHSETQENGNKQQKKPQSI